MKRILFSFALLLSAWSLPAQTLAGAIIETTVDSAGFEVDHYYGYEMFITQKQNPGDFQEVSIEYEAESQGNFFYFTLYEQGSCVHLQKWIFNPLEGKGEISFYLPKERSYKLLLEVEIESDLEIKFQNQFELNTTISQMIEVKN